MSKRLPIRRVWTIVEVINGTPALTNFALEKTAMEAWEKTVREQWDGADNPNAEKEIEYALSERICDVGDDYHAELQETDLVG